MTSSRRSRVCDVVVEGRLDRARLGDPLGCHRRVRAEVGPVVEGATVGLAEALDQAGDRAPLKLADRLHAVALEPPRGLRADAGNEAHALALEALGSLLAGEDDEAAGLLGVRGDLGDKLVRADAHRGVEACLVPDAPDQVRHPRDRVTHLREVDVRLVERHGLDGHAQLVDERPDLGRALAVVRVVDRKPVRVGAEAARPRGRHRRPDPELARLVRRRGDDRPRARARHDHGLSDQLGMALQLDRRIERVHVEMRDLPRHPSIVGAATDGAISGRSGRRPARECPRP